MTPQRTSVLLLITLTIFALGSACGAAPAEPEEDVQPSVQDVPPTDELDTAELDEESLQAPADFTPSKDTCPGVDSILVQLMEADEPAQFAAQQQLSMRDNAVQVVIQLATEDTTVLDQFDITVDSRSGSLVQAHVPVTTVLCDLARHAGVVAVRTPDRAIIQ